MRIALYVHRALKNVRKEIICVIERLPDKIYLSAASWVILSMERTFSQNNSVPATIESGLV